MKIENTPWSPFQGFLCISILLQSVNIISVKKLIKIMNDIFKDKFNLEIEHAKELANHAQKIDHSGIKGQIREITLEKLIKPFLPNFYQVGNGKLVAANNNQSRQMDIIVYSKYIMPPILYNTELGIFPAESCLAAIEVKSKLDATEIQTTINKLNEINSINYPISSGFLAPNGFNFQTVKIKEIFRVLFAYDSDAKGSEVERYKTYDPGLNGIDCLCIIGKGLWVFAKNQATQKREIALSVKAIDNNEVMMFLAVLLESINDSFQYRGLPPARTYFIDEKNIEFNPNFLR